MDFKEQNILFLKGIHLQDLIQIEDLYQKELLNSLENNVNEVIYDKIAKQFTKIENWRKTTNIRCWYCSLKFKNIPWFIIENTNSTPDGITYDINGNFCSCGCLLGYINRNYNKRDDFDIYKSVYKLYKIIYNKNIKDIIESPSKYILKIYGGDASIEEYQNEIKRINKLNINNGY
jgi:hypothetical protein